MQTDKLDAARRIALRQQSLGWLKGELERIEKELKDAEAKRKVALIEELEFWFSVPDLESVREESQLQTLPDEEHKIWNEFWDSVRAVGNLH